MNPDESFRPVPRSPHRFVPTLTEVVPQCAFNSPSNAPEMTQERLEEIVDHAFRRAEDALLQRVPEVLAVMLHEQALAVSERLRGEIKSAVRQSVASTLSEMLPGLRVQPDGSTASRASSRESPLG